MIACPLCGSEELDGCSLCRSQMGKDIPDLIPPSFLGDPVIRSEIARYDAVARKGPDVYGGYAATKPRLRAGLIRKILEDHGVESFAEIGPGFGELLAETGGMERVAVDQCLPFLERIQGAKCVRGLAELLPLSHVPALVADSVFQTLPRKEAFLCEAGRVTDLLVMSVGFRWNYPRRPQQGFDVRNPDELKTLRRFLEELGFSVLLRWYDTRTERWTGQFNADYLYVVGRK